MGHSYIDYKILYDFSDAEVSSETIFSDLRDVYKITNIGGYNEDDKFIHTADVADELYDDYFYKRANYRAYIEEGMNLRMLAELRKSALIKVAGKQLYPDFYMAHNNCETVKQVSDTRVKFLKFLNADYIDMEWQTYYIIRRCWGTTTDNILLNFEYIYEDGDRSKQQTVYNYRFNMLKNYIPEEQLQWLI